MKRKTNDILEDQTFIIMDKMPNSDMTPKERRLIELINGAEPNDENERQMLKEFKKMESKGKIVWTS